MAAADLSFAAAAFGGALSFLSPCVLPLVPAYLCFVAGTTLEGLMAEDSEIAARPERVLIAAAAFVLGFSTVFVALGASASAVNRLLVSNLDIIGKVAGVVIVVFGLHYMGAFRISFLNREMRFMTGAGKTSAGGLLGAYVVGLAFAFGWTPCIGPILATILTIAASRDSLGYGTGLLAAYALGLGLPFLLAAYAVNPFLRFMRGFRKHLRTVEVVAGALLVVTGALIFTNNLGPLGYYLLEAFPALGRIG
ncbi:MAG TPA: cytochrome c biogenesis protein CcdA [Candidatus Cybelea sp.]|nr:cytochrome c biogenesis protein CcdA [Candidatus Cybelea sp.]